MKALSVLVSAALVFLICLGNAEACHGGGGRGKHARPDRKQHIEKLKQLALEKFDADGDGKLSREERAQAKAFLRAKHGKAGSGGDKQMKAMRQRQEESGQAGSSTAQREQSRNRNGASERGNNGVGNGVDPQPRGNPPVNDGAGTGPGNPGNRGGANR